MSYDTYFLNFPTHIESVIRKILRFMLKLVLIIVLGQTFSSAFGSTILGFLLGLFTSYIISWLIQSVYPILILICYRKHLGKMPIMKTIVGVLLFPLFDKIGKWSQYIALFMKVEWKPIPHDTVMDMKDLNVKV